MLKVCHIASGDLWAGAEVQVANLVTQLKKDPTIEVALLVMNEGRLAEHARSAQVRTEILDERTSGFSALISKAKVFLKEFTPDILHSHRYKENVLAAMARSAAGKPALVRTQHGMPEPFAHGASLQHRVSLLADRFVARRMTSRIIAVSSDMREQLARIYPAERITLIPNGIDADALASATTKAEARAQLGFAADVPLIGYCGRLEPIKRIDLFLDAAKLLKERLRDAKFVIAGDGNERARLEQRAEALGLRESVMFLGHRSDVALILRALDIFSLTSDHEGLPMVLLEALAAETLVVAREVGGIPDVIAHEQNGLLVHENASDKAIAAAIANAWQRALTLDAATKRAWSEAGARTVRERFSAKRNADAMSVLYREVLR
jgi:glycosyltransferase involved in cell wall biosynthesis